MTRVTGIESMMRAAVQDAERGRTGWHSVTHYSAEAHPIGDQAAPWPPGERRTFDGRHYAPDVPEGARYEIVLRHYGTPILYAWRLGDGAMHSALGPSWWGSATDCSAIAKAHRVLGMRRSIKRGRLVAW